MTSADEVSSALLRSRPCRQRASSALVAPRDEATSSTHLRIVACAGPATPDTGVGARSSSPRPTLMDAPAGMPNPSFWSWHSKAAFARTQVRDQKRNRVHSRAELRSVGASESVTSFIAAHSASASLPSMSGVPVARRQVGGIAAARTHSRQGRKAHLLVAEVSS